MKKGRFAEAKTNIQQALKLLPEKSPQRPSVLELLQQSNDLLALEAKLPDVLADKVEPADNEERLGFIMVCVYQQRHAATAKLYTDAFTADDKLRDDLPAAHRFNAACAATLAAAGEGKDADNLGDNERVRLRQQALNWLRADLNLWSKRLEVGKPEGRQAIRTALQNWQRDPGLATVRGAEALKKLPAEEQQSWRKLWADVADLLKKAADAN